MGHRLKNNDLRCLEPTIIERWTRTEIWDDDNEATSWQIAVSIYPALDDDPGDIPAVEIFWMDGVTFETVGTESLDTAIDSFSSEMVPYRVLTDGCGDLREEFDCQPIGQLVIIRKVRLDPDWRHRGGVGRYLAAVSLRTLLPGATCVALVPAPYELRERQGVGQFSDSCWNEGVAALRRLWSEIGFRSVPNSEIMVLDPTSMILEAAIAHLRNTIRME